MKQNNPKLTKKLSQYGSLALAIVGVAETSGQVIYTDIEPDYSGDLGSSYAIDFDGDGVDDVILSNTGSFYYGFGFYALYAEPQGDNTILGSIDGNFAYPYALNSGDNISSGASGSFVGNAYANSMFFAGSYASYGNWINVTDKYLGVEFDISGDTHYGWIRLDVDSNTEYVVKDFAYQATPDEPILAGEMPEESCDPPENVVGENIMETSAEFSWDASDDETNGYNWAVFEAGADPETDDPIADGNVASGITSVEITDLTPNTEYDFYVQTVCDDDATSNWTTPESFITEELSVALQSLEKLNYYPNPVQDILTIEAPQQVNQLQVYDLSGRLILDKKPNQQSFTVDTNTIQSGAYFIKVSIDDKHKVFKVIKK